MGFVKSAAKKSLLALTKKGELTPRFWARFFEAFVTKDELISFSDSGAVDHGLLSGLTDEDHSIYYNAARHTALSHSFVDHDDLTNAGTNTHSDIDDHIDDGTIHFTEASLSLEDYVLTDGTRNITGSFTFEGSDNDVVFEGDEVTFDGSISPSGGIYTDSINNLDADYITMPNVVVEGYLQCDQGISTTVFTNTGALPYLLDETHSLVLCDATSNIVQIQLPSTADAREGIIYTIKAINVDNAVTLTPDGLEEIDGSNTPISFALNRSITIQSDGSNWWSIPDTNAIDYSFVSGNDASTDVAATELEELSDGSDTSLHIHDTMYYTKTETISITSIFADGTSGTVTVNLPEASTVTGYVYNIKAINVDNAVTVSTFGVEEIDGSSTDITLYLMESLTVQSDGSSWWII